MSRSGEPYVSAINSLEQWILNQSGTFNEAGQKPWDGSTAHEIRSLADPDT